MSRTVLQRECDDIDCDLYRLISRVETLADRIPTAGPQLRGVANALWSARPALRKFMHPEDRSITA